MILQGRSHPSVLFLLINAESGRGVSSVFICQASVSSERRFSICESFTGEQTFLSLIVQQI